MTYSLSKDPTGEERRKLIEDFFVQWWLDQVSGSIPSQSLDANETGLKTFTNSNKECES